MSIIISGTAISTHAPRTGSDYILHRAQKCARHFNPRSPHGERREAALMLANSFDISTHAPRTGSDKMLKKDGNRIVKFQPTLPARGATEENRFRRMVQGISTHAPRTGSDQCAFGSRPQPQNFNPRSPHGERRFPGDPNGSAAEFQPTLPARGATGGASLNFFAFVISTHAPRTGSDDAYPSDRRLPFAISTHAPRTGSDSNSGTATCVNGNFNPRSPHGERRKRIRQTGDCLSQFQPTLPARGATP